jgi:uncharacterized protein YukE
MIVIKDSGKFSNIIMSMEKSSNRIKEIFDKVNSNMETINGTDIWSGKTQEEFSKKYKELSSNYDVINDSLSKYIQFMKTTLDNYVALENKIGNDADRNNNTLDVNN